MIWSMYSTCQTMPIWASSGRSLPEYTPIILSIGSWSLLAVHVLDSRMWFDQLRNMTGEPDMPGREAVSTR
jgi:hypothetical protein